jgi:K+-transporting ATPase A subunit
MERGIVAAAEKENAMFLLKCMVILCIVCVIVTLYAECRRMSRFEQLLQTITANHNKGRGHIRLSVSGSPLFQTAPYI